MLLLLAGAGALLAATPEPEERFKEGTALLRSGDLPGGIAVLRELAASGHESVNLYWNWAQGAAARGRAGEAMWALLRGREIGPPDDAAERDIERLRQALQLDRSELEPVPVAALGRLARRWHFGLWSVLLVALALHLRLAFWRRAVPAWAKAASLAAALAAILLGAAGFAGASAPPTAVVTARDVPLLDAASPTARTVATLREGEVVPVHDSAGEHLRIQDSSGARGWARTSDVWRLDAPPSPR
ncbi:MAG TPA: SH3 domain-containing protein [Thermoanaerobaculaceae bacterium]|nr:SH3 domain-containing protein [Thermoanaerobaculaceae bacterium]HRS15328.1 SH3 domain-containing protein [Thermoanaerobaculaceae bacterium]